MTPADNLCKVMGRVASVILKKLHLDLTSEFGYIETCKQGTVVH